MYGVQCGCVGIECFQIKAEIQSLNVLWTNTRVRKLQKFRSLLSTSVDSLLSTRKKKPLAQKKMQFPFRCRFFVVVIVHWFSILHSLFVLHRWDTTESTFKFFFRWYSWTWSEYEYSINCRHSVHCMPMLLMFFFLLLLPSI